MYKKRISIVAYAFILFACFIVFPGVCVAQQDVPPAPPAQTASQQSPIKMREAAPMDSALQDSLKTALEENKNLKTANENLKSELDKYISRANVLADRIRRLIDQGDQLEKQAQDTQTAATKEKEQLDTKIEILQGQKQDLEKLITQLKEKRREDEYYILWMGSESKRISTEAKIKEIAAETERLKEENGKLHYNLGNILFKKGEYKKAAYEYEYALNDMPDDPDLYYNLAVINDYYVGDSQKAAHFYAEFLRRQPNAKDALHIKERIAEKDLEIKMWDSHMEEIDKKELFGPSNK
ncbi:tetratricopeptide repeat protein [Candidatus Omnitrophota bacterium]